MSLSRDRVEELVRAVMSATPTPTDPALLDAATRRSLARRAAAEGRTPAAVLADAVRDEQDSLNTEAADIAREARRR